MKAVAYVRVSTDEQVRNTSLASQEHDIRRYCESRGYTVARLYRDEGASAKTADRPQLQAMLAAAKKRGFERVIVWKIDRLARNMDDHVEIALEFRRYGVEIESATEPIDETPAGKFMKNMLAATAQFDNDIRSQRTRRAMIARVQAGGWPVIPPLGYTKGEGGLLGHDPVRAPLVRQAFERIAAGEDQETVRRDLNTAGLRTRRGHEVPSSTLNRMVRHKCYMGRIVIDGLGLDCPAKFEPLISPVLFGVVQQRLSEARGRQYVTAHPDFPLRRFAMCGECGRPMTGGRSRSKNGKRYGYYFCRVCSGQGVPRRQLHARFRELLDSLALHEDLIPFVRIAVLDAFEVLSSRHRFELRRLKRDLRDVQRKVDQLEDAYIFQQRISQSTYDREHARLVAEQDRLGTRIAMLGSTKLINSESTVDRALSVLTNLTEIWNTAETHARRAFQRLLYPDGVEVIRGEFRTPRTARFFNDLRAIQGGGGCIE